MSEPVPAIKKFSDLANPTVFLSITARIVPVMAGLTAVLFGIGLWYAFTTEGDYQQGETVRIMYVHVPAAWLSMMCYSVMAASALGTLVWRHPLADVSAKAAAPLGAGFTLLALVTGSLWGKPMWGTWWVWDARLTSVFVLFLMYLGLMALTRALDDPSKSARVSAVLILIGFVNIPIIKFSVDWWNTLHQPASVMRMGGSGDRWGIPHAPADHGGGLHPAVLHSAFPGDPQRDLAPARCRPAQVGGPHGDEGGLRP